MYSKVIKRILDVLVSIISIPFFCFVFCFLAPIIYLTDRGPVFYKAERLGWHEKKYMMYKFRSMKVNAPDLRNADGSTYNSKSDPRVTVIGRIMRKTSLDELPQMLNVLKGDMSIIGPRPFIPIDGLQDKSEDYRDRLSVRPGITGYTQAYYRNSISQAEKTRLDAEYARNVSFFGDLKIVLKTIQTVVLRKNIYSD